MSDNFLKLAPGHKLHQDGKKFILLSPEGSVELHESEAAILKLCDGSRSLKRIVEESKSKSSESEVLEFIEDALAEGWIS